MTPPFAYILAIVAITGLDDGPGRVHPATVDPSGIRVHRVESPYQSGPTSIRILLPPQLDTAKAAGLPVIYVLPVEARDESRYGDGLRAIRDAGLDRTFPAVYVAPTFAQLPWYADHPTDPGIRQESHFLRVVVPFIQRSFPGATQSLLGFSKSGYGAWTLMLRHPGRFQRAAAWDAPLMMDRPGLYGSGPIYGSGANFEGYRISRLLPNARGKEHLIHLGYSSFRDDHERVERLLEGVPHIYRPGPKRAHRWDSGWLTEAIEYLLGPPAPPLRQPVTRTWTARGADATITFTPRVAFSVHSLRWRGQEFVDSFDHGRQIQSASNLDLGKAFHPETFNPTEAGSRDDGASEPTRSRVLELRHGPNWLETRTEMAFWLQPGEESGGFPALNRTIVSNHILEKRAELGIPGHDNVIRFDLRFILPNDETHKLAQFEALTGYMPREFERFWAFDAASGMLLPLSDGPGEQSRPVILATADGRYAMGVYAPDQPSPGFEGAGYGRFRFPEARVTKWNTVFRVRSPKPGGQYAYTVLVPFGTLDDVRLTLKAITRKRP